MNNYKFRGKIIGSNVWAYGFFLEDRKITECKIRYYIRVKDNDDYFFHCEVLPETVGQWTGLLDKNGNSGFCGDLVKDEDGTIYQIVFNAELASFCLKFSFGKSCCFNSFDRLNKLSAYDIIGNIHDNPELLKVK